MKVTSGWFFLIHTELRCTVNHTSDCKLCLTQFNNTCDPINTTNMSHLKFIHGEVFQRAEVFPFPNK